MKGYERIINSIDWLKEAHTCKVCGQLIDVDANGALVCHTSKEIKNENKK